MKLTLVWKPSSDLPGFYNIPGGIHLQRRLSHDPALDMEHKWLSYDHMTVMYGLISYFFFLRMLNSQNDWHPISHLNKRIKYNIGKDGWIWPSNKQLDLMVCRSSVSNISPHRHLSLLHKGVVNSPTFLAESHRNPKKPGCLGCINKQL